LPARRRSSGRCRSPDRDRRGCRVRRRPEQRLLDAQLAAELDERGDAVAQQSADRQSRVEQQFVHHRVVVGAHVARIAADPRALAGDADFQERLAEIVTRADVGDQPVRGAVTGMHMGVDEARRDQLVAGVDLAVDRALEALAIEQHEPYAFIDQLGVAPLAYDAALCATSQPQVIRVRMKSPSMPLPSRTLIISAAASNPALVCRGARSVEGCKPCAGACKPTRSAMRAAMATAANSSLVRERRGRLQPAFDVLRLRTAVAAIVSGTMIRRRLVGGGISARRRRRGLVSAAAAWIRRGLCGLDLRL
jgi:hypothetical protein